MTLKAMIGCAGLMAATMLAAPAQAGAPGGVTADVAPAVVSGDNYPAVSASFAGGVKGLPDIRYSTVAGYQPLTLDLYLPPQKGPRPLVMYIHGGGWVGGQSRAAGAFANWPAVLASLAARGYVVASINYRLSGEARFPAAIQDVKAAIRFLRANAAKYGIDKTKAVVWGSSAGGQLAALAATACGLPALEPAQRTGPTVEAQPTTGKLPESDCVQGAAIWYGIFDFPSMAGQRPPAPPPPPGAPLGGEAAFLGCRVAACPDAAALASPATHIDRADPPFLLIHGVADRTVPVAQSQEMAAKLKAAGVPVDLIIMPGIDHSFIGATPAETREASLKALTATFEFVDKTVGPQAK